MKPVLLIAGNSDEPMGYVILFELQKAKWQAFYFTDTSRHDLAARLGLRGVV